MKLTKEIEQKLRKFDWKYVSEVRPGIWEILDPKKQEPECITVLNEDEICFSDNCGCGLECCIELKDILILGK